MSNPFPAAVFGLPDTESCYPVLNEQDNYASLDHHVFKDLHQRDAAPPHPGEILRDDIFPTLGMTRAAFARKLAITPRRLANLMAERTPMTADLAIRLGTVLGHGARYWLGLQMQHDIWLTAQPLELPVRPLEWKRPEASRVVAQSAGYR